MSDLGRDEASWSEHKYGLASHAISIIRYTLNMVVFLKTFARDA